MASSASWKRWSKTAIRAAKLGLGVLIVMMAVLALQRAQGELRSYSASIRPDPLWCLASGVTYLAGLCCFGWFFSRILGAAERFPGVYPAIRAYLIGHLGKYVPGKAMVVVLRVGLVTPQGTRPTTAALATLYETLVMMATGGLVAGVLFFVRSGLTLSITLYNGEELPLPLSLLGLAIGLPLLGIALPWSFPKLASILTLPFKESGTEAWPRFSIHLLLEGLFWSLLGWILLGISLIATIVAIDPEPKPIVAILPDAIGAAALATVAGFLVAIFPGGLVIREAVLTVALTSTLGGNLATVSALALRLIWVLSEILAAGVLAALRPKPIEPPTGPVSQESTESDSSTTNARSMPVGRPHKESTSHFQS